MAQTHTGIVMEQCKLNNGLYMPRIGFGTWELQPGRETKKAVAAALQQGYRLIDTAAVYGNETDVGQAIRESGILREELFVTTKLWNTDHGYDQSLKALAESLDKLQMDYVDLYLIHWPQGGHLIETWRALRECEIEGRVKSIGVSNFSINDLEILLDGSDVIPVVNQIKVNPFTFPKELMVFCAGNRIQIEAYSPLNKGKGVFDNSSLEKIADKHGKSPAQIMLRWTLQHNCIVIPRSRNEDHIRTNFEIDSFELDTEDMTQLDSLSVN